MIYNRAGRRGACVVSIKAGFLPAFFCLVVVLCCGGLLLVVGFGLFGAVVVGLGAVRGCWCCVFRYIATYIHILGA